MVVFYYWLGMLHENHRTLHPFSWLPLVVTIFSQINLSPINHHFLKSSEEWVVPIVITTTDRDIEGDLGGIDFIETFRQLVEGLLVVAMVHLGPRRDQAQQA